MRNYESVVEGANEDELGVGGKLDKGDGRVLVVDKGLDAVASGGVPDSAEAVVAAGDDEGAVAVEVHGGDGVGVGGEDLEALAGLHIPNPNGLVEGAGDDDVRLRVEIDAEDKVSVALQRLYKGPRRHVPEAEGLVVGGGDEEAGVGGEGEVRHALLVPRVLLHRGEREAVGVGVGVREAVGSKSLVGGGGGEEAAIGGEFDGGDGAFVARLTAVKDTKSELLRRKRWIYLHSHPMNTILRHRLRLSPTPILYCFPKFLFSQPFHFFSTTTSEPCAFTLSYLSNTCGFSHDVALKLSKRLRFETAEKPDSVFSFFRTHGFSTSQICRIFYQAPELLVCDPTKRLLPKFQFFASKGASPSDTILIVSKTARVLRYGLNSHIIPIFELIRTFLPSDLKALAVFIACPNFIGDGRVASNVQMLLDTGVTHTGIRYLLCSRPSVLCSDLRPAIEEVKLLGFDPLKLSFTLAILAKRAVSKPLWDAKVDVLKKWGWSEDDICVAFRNQPNIMLRSKEKLNAVMGFWVGKLGWDHSVLISSPTLFSYSLEKRVAPRALVVQYLLSKGLVKKSASLATPFVLSDERFLQKYVKRFEEKTPRLLELYQAAQGTC
ncbi:hypothetical protein LR48_Vigan01g308000 [Vigna angularis]|uniref:mTERF protein n=3 Tax=Phaseolus angularis TaxID=3914 RepID=A0A0L9TTN8_PHAAN|nr:hypothetical protein LR48_Vigan01g308000 [Vigna angularis]